MSITQHIIERTAAGLDPRAQRSVGIHATAAALQTAHPAASSAGAVGLVGSAAPYAQYVSNGVAWTQAPVSGVRALDIREFGSLSASSDNSATFAAAVAQAPVGATVAIPFGRWPGDLLITRDNVAFVGMGRPAYRGGVLQGGTIIVGKIEAYAHDITVTDLGVDQSGLGSTYTDGIVTGRSDESAWNVNRFVRIAVLGRGYSNNSLHGIIAQSGGDFLFEDCRAYRYGHGQVGRATDTKIVRGLSENCDLDSYIIKSGDEFPANNIDGALVQGCVARATEAGKVANLIIQGTSVAGKLTRNVSVDGFLSSGSTVPAVRTIGTAGTVRDIAIGNIHVRGCTASRGFAFEGGANITGNQLIVYDGPNYSFGGDGASGIRLLNCVSRAPTQGHLIGSFATTHINGKLRLDAAIRYDDPSLVIPPGAALTDTAINGGLEYFGGELYFTKSGTRYKIGMTAA